MLLLPHIELDEFNNEKPPYLILYNLDMMNIVSIEPDDKGRTVVYHKIGDSYIFNVPFYRFTTMLASQNLVSLYFDKEIDKVDSSIRTKLR